MNLQRGKWKVVVASLSILLMVALLELGLVAQTLEIGRVTVDENWRTVRLNNYFRNPVVVAKPLSYNGGDPAVVRTRDLSSRSFQVRVQEWGYLDDTHAEETVSYLVMDAGRFVFSSSIRVEAGFIETDATGSPEQVSFSSSFRQTPIVFTSIFTYEGEQAAVTRNQNVSAGGFEVTMQEQEANEPSHAVEKIGYIAMEPGSGLMNGRRFEIGSVTAVNELFHGIQFGFEESTTVKVDEETSADTERTHADEVVGYFALEGGPSFFLADMQTTEGSNTANLRYGGEVVPEPEEEEEEAVQPPSQPAPRGIIIEPPPSPGLNVSVRTDRNQYRIGSSLRIFLEVSQRAYLYVFDYDTEGTMRLIFPNRYSQQNLIGPGRYELPDGGYSFQVAGPPGVEFIQAVATTKQVDINSFLENPDNPFAQTSFPRVSSPENLNQEFKSRLEAKFQLQFGGGEPKAQFKLVPVSWDSATTSFRVGTAPQPNQMPVARFSYNPTDPRTRESVEFNAYSSYDPDGSIVSYQWDFNGDGRTDASGRRVINRFYSSGRYNVSLTVEDNDGATTSVTSTLNVSSENQQPTPRFTYSPSRPETGERVNFDGTSSYDPDGSIVSYRWDFNGDGFADASGSRVSYSFSTSGSNRATLTVVDNDGASSSTTVTVRVVQPKVRFSSSEPDSFNSNGIRGGDWRWLTSSYHYAEWKWNRWSTAPDDAYINLSLWISNRRNGGSGFEATVEVKIMNRYGSTIERGEVSLTNPFKPDFSGDTNGVGYEAFGVYEIRSDSELQNGFTVRIEWPPENNRNVIGAGETSAILGYKY